MQVFELMTENVVRVTPKVSLMEAARTMKDLDIGPLPVCEGDRLLGMVTDRDITVRATAAGWDPRRTPVSDVMTAEVVCCLETDEVGAAAKRMQEEQIRRLLVVDNYGQLVGIVSLSDLILAEKMLERVSEPTARERALVTES